MTRQIESRAVARRRNWTIAAAGIGAAIAVFGPAWMAKSAEESLRLGMVAPISGPLAKLGQETVIGSEIAVELINEAGGIKGRKLELVTADTPTPDQAKSAVERLINSDKIKIVVGNYGSSLAIAAR